MAEDIAPVVGVSPLLANVTDKHPPVRTLLAITISTRFRALPARVYKKLVEFLVQQGLQLSTGRSFSDGHVWAGAFATDQGDPPW